MSSTQLSNKIVDTVTVFLEKPTFAAVCNLCQYGHLQEMLVLVYSVRFRCLWLNGRLKVWTRV